MLGKGQDYRSYRAGIAQSCSGRFFCYDFLVYLRKNCETCKTFPNT